MKKYFPLLIAFIFHASFGSAQKLNADSIVAFIKDQKLKAYVKVNLMNEHAMRIIESDHAAAAKLADQSYDLSKKLNYRLGIAKASIVLGLEFSLFQHKYDSAAKYAFEAMEIAEKLKDNKMLARVNNILSMCYETNNDSITMMYRKKALVHAALAGDYRSMAAYTRNISLLYSNNGKHDEANKLLRMGLAHGEKSEDKDVNTGIYDAMAKNYFIMRLFDSSFYYNERQLESAKKHRNYRQMAAALNGLANMYFMKGDTAKGYQFLRETLKLSEEKKINDGLRNAYWMSSWYNEQFKKFESSLYFTRKYDSISLTVGNGQSIQSLANIQQKFDQDRKDILIAGERKRQNIITVSIVGGLLLVITFAAFVFRTLRITKRQKDIIEKERNNVIEQKKLVDEKQKEIIDSITYARRIQTSLLPNDGYINQNIKRLTDESK